MSSDLADLPPTGLPPGQPTRDPRAGAPAEAARSVATPDMPVRVLVARLVALANQDAELRAALRWAAGEFLRLTEPPSPRARELSAESDGEAAEKALAQPAALMTEAASAPPARPAHVALPSAPGIEIPVEWARRIVTKDNDLPWIEARCRLKAEGSRWAAARQLRLRDGAPFDTEIEPKDREIIAKAQSLPNCFLWMNHFTAPVPADLQCWEDVAGCFESAAMAVALLRQVIEKGDEYRAFLEKAIDLTAEAQSALRLAVDMVEAKPDNDQYNLFKWLRQMATEQQVYIQRYMRLDDPADPTRWHDLQERIGQLDAEIDALRQRDKQRTKLLTKAQYHARLIRDGKGAAADWTKVIEAVDTLVGQGTPPSNTDLRDMLLPIVDDLPESGELPDGLRRVLVEIDRHLAMQSAPPPQALRETTSEEVRKAAELYKDKTLVLIGGDRRPRAYEALKAAFGLKELVWISTREHESTEYFVPFIARPDVDAVLLAIRWSSHSYGDVKVICDKHGKEFFRLPAGYNPNQVAHQLLQQRGNKG